MILDTKIPGIINQQDATQAQSGGGFFGPCDLLTSTETGDRPP